jgi:alpha-1,3-rhamnosyl/mannosyltransferase
MRVLIDATPLLLRSAGVKNYIWHWLRALRTEGFPADSFPFVPAAVPLVHERSVLGGAATAWRLGLIAAINYAGFPVLPRADIFHASNIVRRRPSRGRLTVTVYDLTTVLFPEFHTEANIRADREFTSRMAVRADRILAISEATRQDAIRILGLDPDRIDVVYPGVDDRFFAAQPAPAAKAYALYVGTVEPRKNIDTLLDAWAALPADVRSSHDLVIAGSAGWHSEATVQRLSSTPGVVHRGYVPEAELPGLTAGATAFVYPSLYEGFGLPPAQAMAAGVPTVMSDVSSMPEVAGDGALLVDPRSQAEIAAALNRLLTSPSVRKELSAKARAQAARFTWGRSARASIEFFGRAIA